MSEVAAMERKHDREISRLHNRIDSVDVRLWKIIIFLAFIAGATGLNLAKVFGIL